MTLLSRDADQSRTHALFATLGHPRRALLGTAVLAAMFLAGGPLAIHPAQAASACRADPLITLSNGMVVDLSATITDAPSDVQAISYTLHGPKGTSIVSVAYGSDPFAAQSQFTYVADDAVSSYDSYTVVHTATNGIAITASTSATGPQGQSQSPSSQGQSGQTLHTLAVVVIVKH